MNAEQTDIMIAVLARRAGKDCWVINMSNINQSYQWLINACNAPNVGYNQDYRNQRTVNGITYYDCSSIINYALLAGGFETPSYAPTHNAFTTFTMGPELIRLGFTRYDPTSTEWKPGDILVVNTSAHQHTEMVYQGYRSMGAHTDNRALPDQVSINDYTTSPSFYQDLYRYGEGGSATYNWIEKYGNDTTGYLNESERQNNAYIIYSILVYQGWTLNAIAGMLGNMERESYLNPGVYETGGEGIGLVQWTPYPAGSENPLITALRALGLPYDGTEWVSGDNQMKVIIAEYEQSEGIVDHGIEGQWYPTAQYPMSWGEYIKSTDTPEYLAEVFCYDYERAGVVAIDERKANARKWYDYLNGLEPIQPGGGSTKRKRGMPIYMMIRRF